MGRFDLAGDIEQGFLQHLPYKWSCFLYDSLGKHRLLPTKVDPELKGVHLIGFLGL